MPHYSRPLPIPQNQHLTFAEISARMYVKIADFDLIFSSHDPLAINNELEEEPPTISDNEYCDAVVLKENENYVTLDDVEKFKRKTKEDNLLLNKNPGFCRVQSFDKFDAWSYTNSVASSWDSKDDFLSENEGDLFASAEEKQSMRSFTSFSNPFTCALNSIVSIHPCWKRSRLCKVTILTIWHDDKNWATKRSPLKAPCSC